MDFFITYFCSSVFCLHWKELRVAADSFKRSTNNQQANKKVHNVAKRKVLDRLGCSLIVFVFVFVSIVVFFLVRSCLLITLIKCIKGQKSLVGQVMSPRHSDHMSQGSQVSQSALW